MIDINYYLCYDNTVGISFAASVRACLKRKYGERMEKKGNHQGIVFAATVFIITIALIAVVLVPRLQKTVSNPEACRHHFEETERLEADEFTPGRITYLCSKCGTEKTERINAFGKLPQLYFDGSLKGIGKDSDVFVKADYSDEEQHFSAYAALKYQGHTAMLYDKKNFTVKLYRDENKKEKSIVALHGWQKSHKYCLKANYIDFSQSRNIVSANIWEDVTGARNNLNSHIADLAHYGAVDGYPIMLFINEEYQGVYTLNIPKDDDTYHIGDDENEALFVINSPNADSASFKVTLTEDDKKSVFDLEYCYGEDEGNTRWAYDSLDRLIAFVINHDGADFKNGISQYLDVDAAIDYLITAYYLGLTDNFAKNMLLLTYDGEQWIVSLYDMDTAFGLAFDGTAFYPADYQLPTRNPDGTLSSATGSLLWDKLLINYYDEIRTRYIELRKSILMNDKVIQRYDDFIRLIPADYYQKDLEIWGDLPLHNENNLAQMAQYLNERSELLDSFFDYQ